LVESPHTYGRDPFDHSPIDHQSLNAWTQWKASRHRLLWVAVVGYNRTVVKRSTFRGINPIMQPLDIHLIANAESAVTFKPYKLKYLTKKLYYSIVFWKILQEYVIKNEKFHLKNLYDLYIILQIPSNVKLLLSLDTFLQLCFLHIFLKVF